MIHETFNADDYNSLIAENQKLLGQIAELQSENERLATLADTDTLTPLHNRRSFVRSLDKAIMNKLRHGTSAAVVFVDVDGMKAINDDNGHQFGDAVLLYLASYFLKSVRSTDVVARLGGDEFALLLDHAHEAGARSRIEGMVQALTDQGFDDGTKAHPIKLSWGLAMITEGDSVDGLLARADTEMYDSKRAQRSDK
jgi:diguanylate cyclase (GGDEF)-like protein